MSVDGMNVVARLPDPRPAAAGDGAVRRDDTIAAAMADALARGDDAAIRSALHAPPARARIAWQALHDLLDHPDHAAAGAVGLRYVAIPLIVVAGAVAGVRTRMTVADALPEIGAVAALLEQHGAVGPTRNFGMGNALCAVEALEALSPVNLWRALHDPQSRDLPAGLPPAPIIVEPGREQVHLRFLIGAGVTPAHLPPLAETASNISAWGMPLTRELARQLAQPGLEILPMPRPPQSLIKAAWVGRCAQLEAALSLFLGNTVRRLRAAAGDPQAVLSAHRVDGGSGELRLSLSSPFDESLLEGFSWPLHPLDAVPEVGKLFGQMLAECRITDVTRIGEVLPDVSVQGLRFVPAHRLPAPH